MTQYKDKTSKLGENESVPTGIYIYPTLMAADIILYDSKINFPFSNSLAS